jgi:hypothetical protein
MGIETEKNIFSNRLGISYSETFHARDATSIMRLGNKKELSDFRYTPSVNPCTKKKQEKHFERSCRRIFNKMKPQPGATHKMANKLAISKKYRFLFLGSQYIRQPVIHLKYKQARAVPNATIIGF